MLNKYKDLHSQHIDLLVEYYNIHQAYVRKPTYERSILLRNILTKLHRMNKALKDEIQVVRKQMEEERRLKKEAQ
jgi:hypothetical protein